MSETQEVLLAQQMNKSLWKAACVQSTSKVPLSITGQQKKLLITILWLVLGLLNYVHLASCETEFFNVASHKRPTTWPQDATCGMEGSSQFCENTPRTSTEATCVNRSVCDLSCPSTFYYYAALTRPELVLSLLDESRSSGWSECVKKDFSFLCPSQFAGKFSVRFEAPGASTGTNCSLVVDQSSLAPILISDMWNITYSLWLYSQMKKDSIGTLIEITNSSYPLLRISLESLRIKIQSGSVLLEEPSWQIPPNQWNHLVFVVYNDFINIFLNGQFLPPGVFQLSLSPRNIAKKCQLGQSISGKSQFVGYMQNVQVYFGAVSNREVQFMYNQLLTDDDYLIQPNCSCPSGFPALVSTHSTECQQNPGNFSLPDTVPRLNDLAHPIDFITDDDLNTFWISQVNSTIETNSIVIDFGSVYQVQSVHLFFHSPLPLVMTIRRKSSPLSSWQPWQTFSRNCSGSAINAGLDGPCQTISDQSLLNGSLILEPFRDTTPGDGDQLQSFTLVSAINISLFGFLAGQPLYRYHALYEVVVNATCYCYGHDSVCNPDLQSCTCSDTSMTSGLNCETCVSGFYQNSSANDLICHPCDCDVRGTINSSNSNCDVDGGQCFCKPNVRGRQCDICANGFYNLTASNIDGCQMCRCDVNNTVSCDVNTGECICARNVEGSTCDRCLPKTYWSKLGPGCDTCDCFASGTINRSADCDVNTGQCQCKKNVGSRSCGRCLPGFYDLQDAFVDGCVPCNCSALGTVDGVACNDVTGQCSCRPSEGDVSLGGRRCESYFASFYPNFGPESGGTIVSMNVGFVHDVRSLAVSIRSFPCLIDYNSSLAIQVVCVTVPLSNMSELLNQSLPVTIQLPNRQILTAGVGFTYYPDPIIESVWPLRTIESGGINLTVLGSSLRSVAMPCLRVMMVQTQEQGPETVTVFISSCFHVEETLICPTPRLVLPKRKHTFRKRDATPGTVNRTLPDPKNDSRDDLRFYIGFIFDGVNKYLNLSETLPRYGLLDVYENPTIYAFSEPDHIRKLQLCQPYNDSSLIIKGYNLDLGAGSDDYTVAVGLEPCHITQLTSNQITCTPPSRQPKPENEIFSLNGFPAVKVTVGNIVNSPGYLDYDKSCDNDPVVKYSAIASALAALIIIVIIIIVCIQARRKRRPLKKHFHHLSISTEEIYRPTNLYAQSKKRTLRSRGMYLTPLNSSLEAFLCKLPDDLRLKVEDCLLEGQDLTLTRTIGQGNFGQVFVGELTGNDNAPMKVAVKMLRDNESGSGPQEVIDFLDEATLMHQLNAEHILSLIGIILKPGASQTGICIVLPYMENGDLRSFISNEANVLSVKVLLEFGLQVADGMKYLESNKFTHRDLACRNCMVSGDMVVKVADFGLSRDIYEKDYYRVSNSRRPLPIKWMAIESLEAGIFSSKSDVWSYGVLLWELLTRGSTPYPDLEYLDVKAHLKLGKRLTQPDFAPDEIYSLMMECWQDTPEARPTFHNIECRISGFLKISESPSKTNSYSPLQESNSTDDTCISQVIGRNLENYVEMSESELLANGGSQMNNIEEATEDCSITCHEDINCPLKCNAFNELTRHGNICKTNSKTALDFVRTDHNSTPYDNLVDEAIFDYTHL